MSNKNSTPICPHCKHWFSDDQMYSCEEADVYALCPNEESELVTCPDCHEKFVLIGGYVPVYRSFKTEEEAEDNY